MQKHTVPDPQHFWLEFGFKELEEFETLSRPWVEVFSFFEILS